ncbi:MAG: OmpA family protein [Prevotellaceae bacterium]|jgi:outer membrane protein OmpA-like peptidoglycan-associated protein|nr:OmpA family protein [Prevotellaceae bacterium]
MKKTNVLIALIVSAGIILSGCGASNTVKGTAIGGGAGAAIGAGIGALFGKGKGAAIGAAIGTAVGAGAGALIGHKMDKQKEELAKIEGAQVETVTDANNLQAIKVTFTDGILFDTGKSVLHANSKASLTSFAASLKEHVETDVTIYGHTDNTGSAAVNERLSKERAESVAQFLAAQGVSTLRLTTAGKSFNEPVADNSTAAGRAQNRRVEIFITANATMVQQAEQGTLR